MQFFSSTAIHAESYNRATGTLAIQFTSSGQWYDYFNVPDSIYQGLLMASSKGRYFNAYIRDQYAA